MSTHILSEVEATCDRAIIIMDGEIRADAKRAYGTLDMAELRTRMEADIDAEAEVAPATSTHKPVGERPCRGCHRPTGVPCAHNTIQRFALAGAAGFANGRSATRNRSS